MTTKMFLWIGGDIDSAIKAKTYINGNPVEWNWGETPTSILIEAWDSIAAADRTAIIANLVALGYTESVEV